MIKLKDILNEKIDYPDGFAQFIKIGAEAKNVDDFIKKVRKIQNVPYKTQVWFGEKYNPKDGLYVDMRQASELFLKDIKAGKYK